jgi:ABC-type glycerol-3-phosphate transport system permease component
MLVICLPGIWIVLSSLRPTVEIMAKPPVWIPQEISLDAYIAMFSGVGKGGIPVIDYFRAFPGLDAELRQHHEPDKKFFTCGCHY